MMDQLPDIPLTHLAVPVYIIVMLLELAVTRATGTGKFEARDSAVNMMTSVGAGVERVASGAFYGLVLIYFYQFRLFDFEFSWLLVAICFVADDLCYYWKHRFEHRIRWGWASHVVHHSSQHLNTSTALRQTWTFAPTGLILVYVPLVLIGFHPLIVGFCSALNLVYQFFIHTETVKKLPRWYEAVMNTPSHHRVHHASNPKYLDANYAGTLIIWDKMFGTFVPEDENEPCRYGLVRNLKTFNVFRVMFHEWIGIWHDVTQPDITVLERLKYAFMPPGWSHDGSRESSEMIKMREVELNPEKSGQPGLPTLAQLSRKRKASEANDLEPAE